MPHREKNQTIFILRYDSREDQGRKLRTITAGINLRICLILFGAAVRYSSFGVVKHPALISLPRYLLAR